LKLDLGCYKSGLPDRFQLKNFHPPTLRIPASLRDRYQRVLEIIPKTRPLVPTSNRDGVKIGVGRANAPPPSEPDRQFSSVRLSS
jgi:hypothetical protein